MAEIEDETSESKKKQGNDCVKNNKYEEAILHYTHAIKLDAQDYTLYSNRSLAFFKMQQYYFAMQDAEETIKRAPQWVKGYFRQGEVHYASFMFSDAIISYGKALQLQPGDAVLMEALNRAVKESKREHKLEQQIPWLGAALGITVGVTIIMADYFLTKAPTLKHPILMILLTISVSIIGYGIARACRYYIKCQRMALIEPPIDLFKENVKTATVEDDTTDKTAPRYTKSQARQRFKKGKL